MEQPPGDSNAAHRRRPRYAGTHPRSFAQKYKEHTPGAYPDLHQRLRAKGKTPAGTHVPVLLEQVMRRLGPGEGDVVADCTVGYGGHAIEFLRRIGPSGRLIGFEIDGPQLLRAQERLASAGFANARLHRLNFAGLGNVLREEGLDGYNVIFADLGVSSMQVDDPSRGISYRDDGPLDMRMDDRLVRTGADLLATLSIEELSKALWELSDEPDHLKIAQWIVRQRQAQPITTTAQLSRLVLNAKGFSPRGRNKPWQTPGGLHPAARTFQALRILVNDELGSLGQLLRVAPYVLAPGGRLGIISFHSGEDRMVKHSLRDLNAQGVYEAMSDEVIRPSAQEVASNPRSASAKFRWAVKARGEPCS